MNDNYDTRPERPAHVDVNASIHFDIPVADGNYGDIVALALLAVLVGGVVIYLVG